MLNTNFAPWPSFTEEEVDAVADVLRSNKVNYWTGEECRAFECEFAEWVGTKYAIALANGTVALDLALHGLRIGSANGGSAHDEVIVTPRTFLASVSCVVNAGAVPVFADVDRDSGNISAETIEHVLSPRTRGAIIVHLAGWPADMDPIMALAAKHGFKVIEDCAQAHGARYKGLSVGAIGHVGAWSFCQDKIMTTGGEGGMVTTNDPDLWSRMWSYKDHGKSWEAVYERAHPPGFRWVHESFGTNWRMLEMQATIGRIQLRRMHEWTAARARNTAVLRDALTEFTGDEGIVYMPRPAGEGYVHAEYKAYAYVRAENLTDGWDRDRIVAEIVARGVPCYQGSCSEVYLEKAFDHVGWRPQERLPVARSLGETSLMWLVHPTLTPEQMQLAADVSGEVLAMASR
ncbi:DegT/DnrJ/EryC1/StrS family aminotransferase [Sphingopyxis flava]|uniref:dTDP-4-amino-4,6-dideoxygalactose transaminase n=1 Tax=Sphingopyxis flava TaxID=1507287 RepID=A0A1T5F6B7_9SPHN|nr:DegT/DnrJ/EryC1/StrS aminotransferase family protein [Sphingopyxis flava]SKB91712.1 dTDP-4-amino-4,6-dideoxygalactose transaminase [Sphingopyxis flava]